MAMHITITFPDDGARARRVVSRSNYRVSGKHPGFKCRRMYHWESYLERDAFLLLEADPLVLSFREQPAVLTYEQNGEERRHYPDLLVRSRRGTEFVEVKTDKDAESEEVAARTALLQPPLADHGYGYRVWTESEIRVHPRLDNVRYLLRYGRTPVPLERVERLRQLFCKIPDMPWGALIGGLLGPHSLQDACRLVLEGRLVMDLDAWWEPLTPVTFTSGERS